jgi:methyl-accepting chemotaxis protein
MVIEAQQLSLAERWHANVRQNSARSIAVARSPWARHVRVLQGSDGGRSRETTETQKQYLSRSASDPEARQLADVGRHVRKEWLGFRTRSIAEGRRQRRGRDSPGRRAFVPAPIAT